MHARAQKLPLPLAPILPPALRKWAEPIEPAIHRLLVPGRLHRALDSVRGPGAQFARALLEAMNIRYRLDPCDLAHIPTAGSQLVVANHPYGVVEGLILAALLESVRSD